MLSLLIHEHGVSFHLFRCSLISGINILNFQYKILYMLIDLYLKISLSLKQLLILALLLLSHKFLSLFFFFYFLLLFTWSKFYFSDHNFADSTLSTPVLNWSHTRRFLFWLFHFSIIKFPFGAFLSLSFICWGFLFFPIVSRLFIINYWIIFW